MNWPKKSPDSKNLHKTQLSEELARLHCLKSLFSDWVEDDPFLIQQIKDAIENSLASSPELEDNFSNFSKLANRLRDESAPEPSSYGFIHIDFSKRTWDPLFAREELIAQLKRCSGLQSIFVLVKGLRKGLKPDAQYHTENRQKELDEAIELTDSLTQKWSTPSSTITLLYL